MVTQCIQAGVTSRAEATIIVAFYGIQSSQEGLMLAIQGVSVSSFGPLKAKSSRVEFSATTTSPLEQRWSRMLSTFREALRSTAKNNRQAADEQRTTIANARAALTEFRSDAHFGQTLQHFTEGIHLALQDPESSFSPTARATWGAIAALGESMQQGGATLRDFQEVLSLDHFSTANAAAEILKKMQARPRS